jgi:hypothetical protein
LFVFIWEAIISALSRFGIDDLMDEITFVCDRGSNLVKALENHRVVHCFPHRLNNVLKRKQPSSKKTSGITSSNADFAIVNDDPLLDYDDRDSSESESDGDIILDTKAVEIALRSLSTLSERDYINVTELNLSPPAAQVLAVIVRCKQLCCYVKRVCFMTL